MPSPRFEQLKTLISTLRTHLLPAAFDPTGSYENQDEVSTRVLAYRVLAHAEIESYFEDRSIEVLSRAREAWDQGHVSRSALCLIAFSGKAMELPPDTLEAPEDNKRKVWPSLIDVNKKFLPVASSFHRMVRNDNHGIKERNLLSLLLPIGINHEHIDPAFLADMDSFGALRGIAAHSSASTTATQASDPEVELKRVQTLLPGIEAMDIEFDALIASLPAPVVPGD